MKSKTNNQDNHYNLKRDITLANLRAVKAPKPENIEAVKQWLEKFQQALQEQ